MYVGRQPLPMNCKVKSLYLNNGFVPNCASTLRIGAAGDSRVGRQVIVALRFGRGEMSHGYH